MNRQYFLLLAGVALLFSTTGCMPAYKNFVAQYQQHSGPQQPDYNDLFYWAAHPQKADPADSLPAALRSQPRDSVVDVFYLHPTTYTRDRAGWNANINDAELAAKTDYSPLLYQASAFNQYARVFAPRYRQVHLSAFYTRDTAALQAFDTAYADVKNAFAHYLSRYHNGRPIVIASHSQGALMAIRLLREFFDGKLLQAKLVAAYVVGWPVMPTDFTQLKACSTPQQTGCICSWRTFKRGYKPAYVQAEKTTAWVTNPLSWTRGNEYVGREANKGSVLLDFNKIVPQSTDAQVEGGVLWVNRPRFSGSFLYRTKNYHVGDINLYYLNVRENVAQRIEAYLQQNGALPSAQAGRK